MRTWRALAAAREASRGEHDLDIVPTFRPRQAASVNPRVSLSSATPTPSKLQLAKFHVLIEPEERSRSGWLEAGTIGDVLDTPASECVLKMRWYSES